MKENFHLGQKKTFEKGFFLQKSLTFQCGVALVWC